MGKLGRAWGQDCGIIVAAALRGVEACDPMETNSGFCSLKVRGKVWVGDEAFWVTFILIFLITKAIHAYLKM